MAVKEHIQFEGFYEFSELLDQIKDDFGEKDSKAIMRKAMKASMEPVLSKARMEAEKSVDTGALQASLWIESRKPTNKDRRSKYVSRNDIAIAAVTTAPGWKLKKTAFHNRKNTKSAIKQVGVASDARAMAVEFGFKHIAQREFGSAKVPARPFLRPALESTSSTVISILSDNLKRELERYKARQARRAKRMRG